MLEAAGRMLGAARSMLGAAGDARKGCSGPQEGARRGGRRRNKEERGRGKW